MDIMEGNKEKIDWVWDKCVDIDNKYDPGEGFRELNELLLNRRRTLKRRRFIYLSVAAAAILLLLAVLPMFTPDSSFVRGDNLSAELTLSESDFIIKIGEKTYVNEYKNSRMLVEEGRVILKSGKGEESVITSGNERVQVKVPKGMRYSITLEDGSKIWATSNSALSFPSKFSAKQRKIRATGHLFFEIEKAKVPFIVDMKNDLSVIVYGTVFNVKSYSDSNELKICLTEGKVALKIGENENILLPNQTLLYNIEKKEISTKETDRSQNIFWKDGCICFDNMSLEDLAKELSQWYNVSVRFHEEEIKKISFVGNIPDDLNLKEVTEILSAAKKFRAEYKDGVIHLYKY
jgi:ferric-dicitrate binding protein FerR (iron transport regulator)